MTTQERNESSARGSHGAARLQLRAQAIIVAAAVLLCMLAWTLLMRFVRHAASPGAADSAPMDMASMYPMAPAVNPWSPAELRHTYAMWVTMMIAMMSPALVPLALQYSRQPQIAGDFRRQIVLPGWLAAGYLGAWACYAVAATLGQTAVDALQLMTPDLAFANPELRGAVLILAGVNQWLPLKHDCLKYCNVPQAIVDGHGGFRPDGRSALRHGLLAGAYCIGCCWALMAVLFVFGIMQPAWIALLSIVILVEHTAPFGPRFARLAGVGCVAGGLWLMTGMGG